jgi:hypothetical protein
MSKEVYFTLINCFIEILAKLERRFMTPKEGKTAPDIQNLISSQYLYNLILFIYDINIR